MRVTRVKGWQVPYSLQRGMDIWQGDNFHWVNEFLAGKFICNSCQEKHFEIKKMFMTPIDKKQGYFWIWYELDDVHDIKKPASELRTIDTDDQEEMGIKA